MSSPPPNSDTPGSEAPTGGIRCPGCGIGQLQSQDDRCPECGWTLSEQTRRESSSAGRVVKFILIGVGVFVAVILAAFIALFAVCATMMSFG